ncbi:MAG: hypothetical protein LUF04_04480 [Bacteroides sp.]|nr:hypothetical protein [Bacteroides sp.]
MNRIDTLHMDLFTDDEAFARRFCGGWEAFCPQAVERVIEEVLRRYTTGPATVAIEHIGLDLGVIPQAEFRELFPRRLRHALQEFLNVYRAQAYSRIVSAGEGERTPDLLQALIHRLLHGSWPWQLPDHLRQMDVLFREVIRISSDAFCRFLRQYGHYTSMQQRLVWYLRDVELEQGVRLLAPSEATFICGYVRWLRRKYEVRRQAGLRQTDHRHAVWMVVYGWLLRQHASHFHRRTFLMQTLSALAVRYNTSYGMLLRLVTEDIDRFSVRRAVPDGLFALLRELLHQQQQAEWRGDHRLLSRLYLQLSRQMRSDRTAVLTPSGRRALLSCLSQPGSCRLLLSALTDPEIFRLLAQVAPPESRFVGDTAGMLDRGRQEGLLQGKAGGEFRLLKWQLIFPLLLDRRGRSGFDRRSFLVSLLSGIAAHYNLSLADLLSYLCLHLLPVMEVDRTLRHTLRDLYETWVPLPHPSQAGEEPATAAGCLRYLRSVAKHHRGVSVAAVPNAHWLRHLSSEEFRRTLVSRFTRAEWERLLAFLLPAGARPLASVLQALDHLSTYAPLQGRSLGELRQIHRMAFLSVWSRLSGSSLSYDLFLGEMLRELSAQYRLDRAGLLYHLCRQSVSASPDLPYVFYRLLRHVSRQEQRAWLALWSSSGTPEALSVFPVDLAPGRASFFRQWEAVLQAFLISRPPERFSQSAARLRRKIRELAVDILWLQGERALSPREFLTALFHRLSAREPRLAHELWIWFLQEPDAAGSLRSSPAAEGGADAGRHVQGGAWTVTDPVENRPGAPADKPSVSPDWQPPVRKAERAGTTDTSLCGRSQNLQRISEENRTASVRNVRRYFRQRGWELFLLPEEESAGVSLSLLARDPDRLDWLAPVLDLFGRICVLLPTAIQHRVASVQWGRYLAETFTTGKGGSREELLFQLLERLWQTMDTDDARRLWESLPPDTSSWMALARKLLSQFLSVAICEQEEAPEQACFVENAGAVLLSPYLPVLFERMELTASGGFRDSDAQVKAAFLIQYLVWGDTLFPEADLLLNKVLTGLSPADPLPPEYTLSPLEKETADGLLRAVLQHWDKLSGTSVEGFRESFLQREGKLEYLPDQVLLTVESRVYDLLLDTVPWSYHPVRWSWMEKPLDVKWR